MQYFSSLKVFFLGNWIWLLIFLLALCSRSIEITALSPVISHDEIYYVAEAKSIAVSGKDPTGQTAPWQLKAANPLYAELPGLVMVPAAVLFSESPLLAARVTHVVIGSLLPLLVGWLCYLLFKDKRVSIIAAALVVCNPWMFQNSRMGFDALFSIFFYLLALIFVLQNKRYTIALSAVFFTLGFYQYQGLKILLLPIVFLSLLYRVYIEENEQFPTKKLSQLFFRHSNKLALLSFTIIFFVLHMMRLSNNEAGKRVQDLIFFDQSTLSEMVDIDRRLSLNSPIQTVFSNKFTALVEVFSQKYLDSFNFHQLFLSVDARRNPFAVTTAGIFHLIDLPLLILGTIFLWSQKKYRLQAMFVFSMIVISPLPSAINSKDTWMMFRSSFMFVWLIVLIAFGVSSIIQNRFKILTLILLATYTVSIISFGYEYFFSYPIRGTNGIYFSERILANYIARLAKKSPENQFVVLTEEPRFTYETVLVYTNSINRERIKAVQKSYTMQEGYKLENILVTSNCFDPTKANGTQVFIVDARTPLCDGSKPTEMQTPTIIPSLIDSGGLFYIYNDQLCAEQGLSGYPQVKQRVFSVEKLTTQTFCRTFLTR